MLGSQWGDEGKGKIVDLLTESHSGRPSQGGHNAGHTPKVVGGEKKLASYSIRYFGVRVSLVSLAMGCFIS